ncbi:MAG: methylated-DNA--[protein]-cysteine S-methyltransferase [Bacteroidetes bacterium]|nr:methylated-DNA--[protein]-cysteine S-methyltransferase [Bacteroidota bacterium]
MTKSQINTITYQTSIGTLVLGEFNGQLCCCDWKNRKLFEQIQKRIQSYTKADFIEKNTSFLNNVTQQLDAYFKQELTTFDIPLFFAGTEFQKQVWYELIKTPYGQTTTYLSLSKKLNNESAIRAVASANGANAISIIVPCHRVIGSDGNLVGYAGGLYAKKKLLEIEQVYAQPELF